MRFSNGRHCSYSFVRCQSVAHTGLSKLGERHLGKGENGDDGNGERRLSRFSKVRLWLAGYSALEVVADRDNDHLLRDAGLSRDEAQDSLRAWRIVGLLLMPRSGRE
jgi:hypothetical protein